MVNKEVAMARILVMSLALFVAAGWLSPATGWAQGKSATAAARIDLNTATQAELEKLPGVGEATAKKIIAGRPYSAVGDLSKAGVPSKTIEKITPLVSVAGAAPATAAPAAKADKVDKAPTAAGGKSGDAPKSSSTEARVPPAKGMVWVNTSSGVFHHEGDRWYGKTKTGKFMTEADAVKAGYRASKEGTAKADAVKK
jgi:hypothetical protein